MAEYRVNEAGVAHARQLIDARQYVLRSEWGRVQPSAEDGNELIRQWLAHNEASVGRCLAVLRHLAADDRADLATLSDASVALATVQEIGVPMPSTRTECPPASQVLTTSTPATSLSCWVSDASTLATSTKLLSLLIWSLPSSSVCSTVKVIGWPSSDAEQVNVAPASALMSAGQETSVGATPAWSSVSCAIWRSASAVSRTLVPNSRSAPTARPPSTRTAATTAPMMAPVRLRGAGGGPKPAAGGP